MESQNAYVLVAVRADILGQDSRAIEAICSSPGRARELRRALIAGDPDVRLWAPPRAYVSVTTMDRLYAMPHSEDEVLEASEEGPIRA